MVSFSGKKLHLLTYNHYGQHNIPLYRLRRQSLVLSPGVLADTPRLSQLLWPKCATHMVAGVGQSLILSPWVIAPRGFPTVACVFVEPLWSQASGSTWYYHPG